MPTLVQNLLRKYTEAHEVCAGQHAIITERQAVIDVEECKHVYTEVIGQ